jgi:Asp/Glu/hydantoin racemase
MNSSKIKIWFQALSPSPEIDPRWQPYQEACERYVPKIARPGTEVRFASTDKRAPNMIISTYIQYLHLGQVIDNAIQAEKDGYDAFVIGGMRDLGYTELREVVDIPVLFISEVAYHHACMLAEKFAVIHSDEHPLQVAQSIIERYGLENHVVEGGHVGYSQTDLIAAFKNNPSKIVQDLRRAAEDPIRRGAGLLVPGFAAINVFLGEMGIRDFDGVPILDCQAVAIKTAEMMVDMRRLGMPKPGGPGVGKKDIEIARKVYGVG